MRKIGIFTYEWSLFKTPVRKIACFLHTGTDNLFSDWRALDSEKLQSGDKLCCDGDLVLGGVELDLVLGLRVV